VSLGTVSARWPHAVPVALIIGAVAVANALYLSRAFDPNPVNQQSGLATTLEPGLLPGLDTIDPNAGFTSQALGHHAVMEWLGGRVPWWNAYEGIGAPLAANMHSAAFFPLVALVGFPSGQVFFFAVLEAIGGIATYLLLRRLSICRAPALAGGIAFALNGTFAWFRYAASNPIALLPLLLLGVERAFENADLGQRAEIVLVAVAVALSLYSGFPETAFLDGLLAAVWVIARASEIRGAARIRFLAEVAGGGVTGVLLAAPVVGPFLHYLLYADIGGHAGAFAHAHLQTEAVPMLLLPYIYGPIFGFTSYDGSSTLMAVWSSVGGYLTTSVATLAFVGVAGRRHRALRVSLALWIVAALGKTYGLTTATFLLNLVPGVSATAFYRYVWPSVTMAVIVLASFGFQDVVAGEITRRRIAGALVLAILVTVALSVGAFPELHRLSGAPHLRSWALASAAWAATFVVGVSAAALVLRGTARAFAIASLVVIDACALLIVPQLSAPRAATIDLAPVAFLRSHLATSRFYTLGPIQPNYGAYFGIASINVNNTPIPQAWSSYVVRNLDPGAVPLIFTGTRPQAPAARPTAAEVFLEHLAAYEEVAVKYVVVPAGLAFPKTEVADSLRQVFSDAVATIFELPNPRPYFEASVDSCTLEPAGRERVHTSCPRAFTLLRRELFMPGWEASADGEALRMEQHGELFQAVEVPAGSHVVRYRYNPPYLNLLLLAVALGVCLLVVVGVRGRLDGSPPRLGILEEKRGDAACRAPRGV
jgi:hypothetical protein